MGKCKTLKGVVPKGACGVGVVTEIRRPGHDLRDRKHRAQPALPGPQTSHALPSNGTGLEGSGLLKR